MHLHEDTGVHEGNFCSLPRSLALGCELFPMPPWRDSPRRAGEQWELHLLKPVLVVAGRLSGSPFTLAVFHPSGRLQHVAFPRSRSFKGFLVNIYLLFQAFVAPLAM